MNGHVLKNRQSNNYSNNNMKKILYLATILAIVQVTAVSCDDEETYADQKERENKQINQFLKDNKIDVISMAEFLKDTITNNPETGPDTTLNEYVLFSDNGVYMQIVRRGEGRPIESGEQWNMNARYVERYISTNTVMSMNLYEQEPDIFYLKRTGGNYTASFSSGIMAQTYGNSVPNAWIMTFPYISPGFPQGLPSAKVRLIVPHNQGTQTAASSVYPTFYEITLSPQKYNGND